MLTFYFRQLNPYSCSVASVAKIPYKKIDIIPINERLKKSRKREIIFFSLLMKFCTEKNHYIIAHFTQGATLATGLEGIFPLSVLLIPKIGGFSY
jgi:hypothetical protein